MRSAQTPVLGELAACLAEVAYAMRASSADPDGTLDVARAYADVERALSNLAIGAELTANAVIVADRPAGTSPTQVPPGREARALSWDLHTLAKTLRAARNACASVRSAAALDERRAESPIRQG